VSDWNQQIIAEFRANEGRVGGPFEGTPILLLHNTGAKSGETRITPLLYQEVGDDFAVFASKAGAPTHPDWYHNVVANPEAVAEVGTELIPVTARVAEGAERDDLYTRQKVTWPAFAEYQEKNSREIPAIVLHRRQT
jgi:deazaflavin-dependent oxidoreductase (nitroreductase family)